MGNHEAFMRDFLDGEDIASVWLMNGGDATLRSYGLDLAALTGPWPEPDARELRDALTPAMPDAHRAFLDGLALSHIEGDYTFVHAGVRPGVPLERQVENDLLWIRALPRLDRRSRQGRGARPQHGPGARSAAQPYRHRHRRLLRRQADRVGARWRPARLSTGMKSGAGSAQAVRICARKFSTCSVRTSDCPDSSLAADRTCEAA